LVLASWRSSIVEGSFGLVIAATILSSRTIAAILDGQAGTPYLRLPAYEYKVPIEQTPRHKIQEFGPVSAAPVAHLLLPGTSPTSTACSHLNSGHEAARSERLLGQRFLAAAQAFFTLHAEWPLQTPLGILPSPRLVMDLTCGRMADQEPAGAASGTASAGQKTPLPRDERRGACRSAQRWSRRGRHAHAPKRLGGDP